MRKVFYVYIGLLAIVSVCVGQNNYSDRSLFVLNDNGGWCWFQDERAVVVDGQLFVGSVADKNGRGGEARDANIEVVQYDLDGHREAQRTVIHEHYKNTDDHNSPAFLPLPDGRMLVFYTAHASSPRIHYGVKESIRDSAWKNTGVLENPKGTVTYSNLFFLQNENDRKGRIYDFYRTKGFPHFYYSDDLGEHWEFGGQLLINDLGGCYLKYVSDGKEVIHFCTTDSHPHRGDNSIYHGYIKNGKVYTSAGKQIGALGTPVDVALLTRVFEGSGEKIGWTVDMQIDGDGNPYMLFSVNRNLKGVTRQHPVDGPSKEGRAITDDDIRYHYARWNGRAWIESEIAYAGGSLYPRQAAYSGLGALDPHRADVVYISANSHPVTGRHLLSRADGQRHYELFKGKARSSGKGWEWQQLTLNSSQDNIRPIIPVWEKDKPTVLLWLYGKMTTFTDYNLQVVGMLGTQPVDMSEAVR